MTISFNLIDEPWIPVLTRDGEARTVGIKEILVKPERFSRISAELPTVSIALQRLLQAVLLRALQPFPTTIEARARLWGRWWAQQALPRDAIEGYLSHWHARFDLLGTEAPFFQVPGLELSSGAGSGLPKLIADVPAGTKFFTVRSGEAIESIPFAEAATWLVHAQAFDCAGIKSGVIGDQRVKGGKNYSFGYPAWAGNLGLISLEGASLFETLLLNLDLASTSADDCPPWETSPQRIASDGIYPEPVGAAQCWTWPSRMIRLIHDGRAVTDVVLSNGERLEPHNKFHVEPMTSWRYSEPQSKKHAADVYMPVLHDPTRAAWRGLAGLLAVASEGEGRRTLVAGSVSWLAQLREQEAIADLMPVRMRCVSMSYGPQASTFVRDFDDAVPMRVSLLTSQPLQRIAVDAVGASRRAVFALRDFAKLIDLAAGASGDDVAGRSADLESTAYAELRQRFESWLDHLSPEADPLALQTDWEHTLRRTVTDVALSHASRSPATAVFGRVVKLNGKEMHMDLGRATLWLRAALRRALPLAHPDSSAEGQHDVVNSISD